jgi:hypothetical protein
MKLGRLKLSKSLPRLTFEIGPDYATHCPSSDTRAFTLRHCERLFHVVPAIRSTQKGPVSSCLKQADQLIYIGEPV